MLLNHFYVNVKAPQVAGPCSYIGQLFIGFQQYLYQYQAGV